MANPLIDAIISGGNDALQSGMAISDIANSMSTSLSDTADLARTGAADAVTVYDDKAKAALLTQTNIAKAADTLGSNFSGVSGELLTALATRMREEYDAADAAAEVVNKKKQNTIFDNPLQWIGDNLMGGLEKADAVYAEHATKYNNAEERYSKINSLTTEASVAQRAQEAPLTAASIAAGSRLAALDFNIKAADFDYKAGAASIEALKAIQTGNQAVIAAKLKSWEIGKTEEELQMRKEDHALRVKEFNLRISEQTDKKAGEVLINEAITRGRAAFKLPQLTAPDTAKLRLLYQTKAGGEQLSRIVNTGVYAMSSGGDVQYGFTPADSYAAFTTVKPRFSDTDFNAKAAEYVIDIAQHRVDAVSRANPKTYMEKINSIANQDIASWTANAESDKSLFKSPGMVAVVEGAPSLKNTPLYQKVLGPAIVANVTDISTKDMFARTGAAITAGDLSIEQARDGIFQYFQTVKALNAARNFSVGIGPQASYRVKVGGMFSEGRDMLKPADITAVLLDQTTDPSTFKNLPMRKE